jgi:hypothetical protein
MSATRRRTFAVSKLVFGLAFLISTVAHTYLFFHYERTRPKDPNPFTGRIYVEHHIGVNFYLTASERNQLRWLTVSAFLFFFLSAACYQLEKRSGPPRVASDR